MTIDHHPRTPAARDVHRVARALSATVLTWMGLAAAGCSEPMSSVGSSAPQTVATMDPWTGRLSGGGTAVHPAGVSARFKLNVTNYADGSVAGTVDYVLANAADGAFASLRVAADCLVIDGNRAWASGPVVEVKEWSIPGVPDVPDVLFVVTVEDNGNDGDLAWFDFAPSLGVEDCQGRPGIPPVSAEFTLSGQFVVTQH